MPELKKNEIKRLTKAQIQEEFEQRGCDSTVKSAGAVDYISVGLKGTDQRCAAIYGARGMGASIWVKAGAFALCKKALKKAKAKVEDVSFFRRGFQWAVYIKDFDDPNIQVVADACVTHGGERLADSVRRAADEATRAAKQADREASMAARRKDPWA